MAFDPSKHLRPMKGGAEYLDVKWRLVWLREEHPDAEVETRALEHEPGKWASFYARVALPGKGSATGHGSETAQDFRDYYEKAETKALGRALAALGYGTQFVGEELDEGVRIVDSPVERPTAPRTSGSAPARPTPPPAAHDAPQPAFAPDDPLAPVLAELRRMETERQPWHEIKAFADKQSSIADDYGKQAITATLHAIAQRRKAAAPAAPAFAAQAG